MNTEISVKSIISYIRGPIPSAILLGLIFLCLLFLFLMNRKKGGWLIWASVPTLIVSLLFVIIYLLGKTFFTVLIFGGEEYKFIVEPFTDMIIGKFLLYAIILLVIGIGAIIIRAVFCNKKEKKVVVPKNTEEKKEIVEELDEETETTTDVTEEELKEIVEEDE